MPAARKPAARRTPKFKEPAALGRFNKSIQAAEKSLAELRQHAGRESGQASRALYKDLQTFVSSARRDGGKFAKELAKDFSQAQKQVASTAARRPSSARAGSRSTAKRSTAKPRTASATRSRAASTRRKAR